MNDDTKAAQRPDEELDLSDFGNLTPIFSNRFYVSTGPIMSRIFFGDVMRMGGDAVYHTSIAVPTVDLILLRDLLDKLLQRTTIGEAVDKADG